jgi:hypothetical protein
MTAPGDEQHAASASDGSGDRWLEAVLDALDIGVSTVDHVEDPVLASCREHGFAGMVAKPFTVDELECVVREVLGAEAPRTATPARS